MFPYLTDDKLYYSSDRIGGVGGLDVYAADYTGTNFESALNLGEPVNSNKDDFSYIVDPSTETGYFASNRSGGKGDDDIYYFKEMDLETVAEASSVIGVVFEKQTGGIIDNATVQVFDKDNALVAESTSDQFGNFEFKGLSQNETYTVKASAPRYKDRSITLETDDLEEVSANLLLERLSDMDAAESVADVTMPSETSQNNISQDNTSQYELYETKAIFFDFEKYSLREGSKNELENLAMALKNNPNMTIKIESHTDSRGSRAFNKWLSQERADSTKDYLLDLGVNENQIESAVGYGEDRPLNECDDYTDCSRYKHQENRRSEFIITNQ